MQTEISADLAADGGQNLWPACLDVLAQELPQQQFNTWIKPLTARVAADQSKLTLFVGNRFKLDWIRAQYGARIAGILESLHGQRVDVELALAPRATPVKPTMPEFPSPAEVASTAPPPEPMAAPAPDE